MSNDLNTSDDVVTRFPPSPTGKLHVGGARTALFNWLYAQKHDGRMVLRFEDTDEERSKEEYAEDIKESLDWLDLDYDGPYAQSERSDIYKTYLEDLLDSGHAYFSDESDSKEGRDEVIRFNNPNKTIEFTDVIRGDVSMDTHDLGDFVIAKSLTEPLYHFAVVIDDFEMNVTHVIRGDEHISNTPRQLLLMEAIDAPRPVYAHMPLILGSDKEKLSKRHGATAVTEFKERGVLASGMINYLALLGWHPSHDQEIFTVEELIEAFELERVQKSPAVFSLEKLRWVNREHIKSLSEEEFYDQVRYFLPEDIKTLPEYSPDRLRAALPILRERTEIMEDVVELAESGEVEFLFEAPEYSADDLTWDDDDPETTAEYLQEVITLLTEVDADNFTPDNVKDSVWEYASDIGRGNVLWPMRFALSGQEQSPGPFAIASVIGKENTINRIKSAIEKLEAM